MQKLVQSWQELFQVKKSPTKITWIMFLPFSWWLRVCSREEKFWRSKLLLRQEESCCDELQILTGPLIPKFSLLIGAGTRRVTARVADGAPSRWGVLGVDTPRWNKGAHGDADADVHSERSGQQEVEQLQRRDSLLLILMLGQKGRQTTAKVERES